MIGGMMKIAMIAAVAYARRGVQAAIRLASPPSSPATRRAWSTNRGTCPSSLDSPVTGSGATRTRPTNRTTYGEISTRKQGRHQAADLGQRVVGPGQRSREVERQDAVALVAPEQLGCLGGAEQHDQDGDETVVGLVADRRRITSPPPPACAASAAKPDRQDGRQDGKRAQV